MELPTPRNLAALSAEVRRVLRPGGLQIYTVRSTADPDYGAGTSRGDDMCTESKGLCRALLQLRLRVEWLRA